MWSCRTKTTATPTATGVIIWEVHEDATGNDNKNLNDEYVILKNTGNSSIDLEGWSLKDEADHTYTFPDFVLEDGSTVTIHSGSGQDSEADLYWGSRTAIWNNGGDTAYLYNQGVLVDEESW